MLVYFARRDAARETMGTYLREWGPQFRSRVRIVCYEELDRLDAVEGATYLFTDLERLNPEELRIASELADELARHEPAVRVMNHPRRVKRRYDLLRLLHEHGINDFRPYRLSELDDTVRFPVFVRRASEHDGPLSGLLGSLDECHAIAAAVLLGRPFDDLLVVEYCDTSDASGLYRKYGCFVVGGEIVPRGIFFDHQWSLKLPGLVDQRRIAEEHSYFDTNPHREQLAEIARLAGTDWGRFDYGVVDGRLQIWELNTCPIIVMRHRVYAPEHRPTQELFASRIAGHIDRLCGSEPSSRSPAPPLAPWPGRPARERLILRARRTLHLVVPRSVAHAAARRVGALSPARRIVRRKLARIRAGA